MKKIIHKLKNKLACKMWLRAFCFFSLIQYSHAAVISVDTIDGTSITTLHLGGDTIQLITTATEGTVQISGGFAAGLIGYTPILEVFSSGLDLNPVDGSDDRDYLTFGVADNGAVAGLNYASMDLDSDGVYETIVEFNFGDSVTDTSDDAITRYAYEDTGANLLVTDAIMAFSVPEPSSSMLVLLGSCFALSLHRRKHY